MGMVVCTWASVLVAAEVYTDLKSAVSSPAVSPRFSKRDCIGKISLREAEEDTATLHTHMQR